MQLSLLTFSHSLFNESLLQALLAHWIPVQLITWQIPPILPLQTTPQLRRSPCTRPLRFIAGYVCALNPLQYPQVTHPNVNTYALPPLVIEPWYANRKAYSSRIQGWLECLWPNGVGRSHQDQKWDGSYLDFPSIMPWRYLRFLRHEHWRWQHFGLLGQNWSKHQQDYQNLSSS